GARQRHQAPEHAQDQEIVAPVVDVDDDALEHDAEIGRIDHVVRRLPRPAHEHEAKPLGNAYQREREERETGKPAAQERLRTTVKNWWFLSHQGGRAPPDRRRGWHPSWRRRKTRRAPAPSGGALRCAGRRDPAWLG